MLLLQLVLDDWPVKQPFEAVEDFESPVNCVVVVEALGDDRGQTTLKLLNFGSELIEVVVKVLCSDVHDVVVVFDGLKCLNGFLELRINLHY